MKKYIVAFALFYSYYMAAQCYTAIDSKTLHNLALRSDGTLWAWGSNQQDQIGDNSNTNQTLPKQIGAATWLMTAAGTTHSLAIKSDGTLWGWGGNEHGESGGGDIPTIISNDTDWVYIAAGLNFSAAIKSNGTLWTWGSNMYGKLGNGTGLDSSVPIQVGTSHDWVTIDLGAQHAAALKSNGTLWTWGINSAGQLGLGNFNEQNLPVQVGTASDWSKIVAGYSNTFGIKQNGTLWACGTGQFGSNGNGQVTNKNVLAQIGTSTWKDVDVVHHVLAIRSDGTLWSWGRNTSGEVGNNISGTNQLTPIQVGTSNNWVKIAAGFYHSLAIKDDGTFWAWGDNQFGTLGNGTFTNSLTPVQIGTTCNTLSCSFPSITLPSLNVQCGVTAQNITAPIVTDSCGNQITGTLYIGNFPITTQGTSIIYWKFSNSSGYVLAAQNIIIDDTLAPVPVQSQLEPFTAECQVTGAMLTAPSAQDACAGVITGTTNAVFPITTQGITTITWTYSDGNGNTSNQIQNIIVDDTFAPIPVQSQLPPFTTQCEVSAAMLTVPTAQDACTGVITATTNTAFPITTQGLTTIVWSYDDGNGNTSTQTQDIIIDDTQAPVPAVSNLLPITAQCQLTAEMVVAPQANDACQGMIVATTSAIFPIILQGSSFITWIYTDENGNSFTQLQEVIIDDSQAPLPSLGILPDVNSQCQVSQDMLPVPTAMDACAGLITGTTEIMFPITLQGTTTITWSYSDGNGNTAAQTQKIIIEDNVAPVPTLSVLNPIAAQCEVNFESVTAPTAIDACAGTVTATTDTIIPITQQGTATVIWTFTDGNGNTILQEQQIEISDTVAPTLIVQDLTIDLNGAESVSITPEQLDNGTSDNCSFELSTDISTFTQTGTYEVTVTASDSGDNIATAVALVTVVDSSLSGEEYQIGDIKLYPIPVENILYIDLPEKTAFKDFYIADNLGRVVYQGDFNTAEINLSHLSTGTYYVSFTSESAIIKKAILKK